VPSGWATVRTVMSPELSEVNVAYTAPIGNGCAYAIQS